MANGMNSGKKAFMKHTPWLCTDHLVVLAPPKKKVAPLAKQFPQPSSTHNATFSPPSTNNA
jgi:hypothetical protein